MSFQLQIDPEWNIIKRIKESLNSDTKLNGLPQDFREATLLTAIELIENALKYSDESAQGQPVRMTFEINDTECTVSVKNRSSDPEHRAALEKVLERIKDGDPFELYVERLQTLKDRPDGFSRMGLIRIVYEGEFQISSDINGEEITITATRKLPGA